LRVLVVQVRGGRGTCDAALFGIEKKVRNRKMNTNEYSLLMGLTGFDELQGWRGGIQGTREGGGRVEAGKGARRRRGWKRQGVGNDGRRAAEGDVSGSCLDRKNVRKGEIT
jgi:hypothetical protein